jgi:MFS family permease
VNPANLRQPVPPSPRSLWRNRDYMCWFSGTASSLVGSNVSVIAFPLLILFGGGSVLQAGLLGAAARIGALVSRLWGGAIADRYSRKAILVYAPLGQGALMAAVAAAVFSGHAFLPGLSAIALASGLLLGVESSATLPALRRLVGRDQLAARAAQEQGLQQATQLVGSPLAGLLFTLARWVPFGFDALSFLAASVGAALIRAPLGPDRVAVAERRETSMLAAIRGGVRIVLQEPFLRYTTAWVAVTNLVGGSVILLAMAMLKEEGSGVQTISVANAVILAGGVIGSVLTRRILSAVGSHRLFVGGNWAYVVTLGAVALTQNVWQLALAAGLFVFASVPTASVWEAYTATLVPEHLFGRVGATTSFAAQSLTWVGALLAGFLADELGARAAIACFAALLVPFALRNSATRSLSVMRKPLGQVPELSALR